MTPEPAPARSDGPTPVMAPAKVDNYRSERGARAYFADHQVKLHRRWSDRRERRILRTLLARCPAGGTLLDVPCGYGRLLDLFAAHAREVVEADLSPSMLALGRELHGGLAADYLECSALAIPRPDAAFDTVVSIRLSHHLESEVARRAHIAELCRVARSAVIMTYFSSTSLKNRLRCLRARWNGKRPKNAMARSEVAAAFASNGFQVVATVPLSRIGSGHDYVLALRAVPAAAGGHAAAPR